MVLPSSTATSVTRTNAISVVQAWVEKYAADLLILYGDNKSHIFLCTFIIPISNPEIELLLSLLGEEDPYFVSEAYFFVIQETDGLVEADFAETLTTVDHQVVDFNLTEQRIFVGVIFAFGQTERPLVAWGCLDGLAVDFGLDFVNADFSVELATDRLQRFLVSSAELRTSDTIYDIRGWAGGFGWSVVFLGHDNIHSELNFTIEKADYVVMHNRLSFKYGTRSGI